MMIAATSLGRCNAIRPQLPLRATPCLAPSLHRPVTALFAASSITSSLVTVLKDELKIEKEQYRQPDGVLAGPPEPFVLEQLPGKSAIWLKREFGEEEIWIEVDLDSQDGVEDFEDEDENEEFEEDVPLRFKVLIKKPNGQLEFDCEGTADEVSIIHMALQGADDGDDGDEGLVPPYTGPIYEDLDLTLQQAFQDYLEERGVTTELAQYLNEATNDKMQVEYMEWLRRMREFVAK